MPILLGLKTYIVQYFFKIMKGTVITKLFTLFWCSKTLPGLNIYVFTKIFSKFAFSNTVVGSIYCILWIIKYVLPAAETSSVLNYINLHFLVASLPNFWQPACPFLFSKHFLNKSTHFCTSIYCIIWSTYRLKVEKEQTVGKVAE